MVSILSSIFFDLKVSVFSFRIIRFSSCRKIGTATIFCHGLKKYNRKIVAVPIFPIFLFLIIRLKMAKQLIFGLLTIPFRPGSTLSEISINTCEINSNFSLSLCILSFILDILSIIRYFHVINWTFIKCKLDIYNILISILKLAFCKLVLYLHSTPSSCYLNVLLLHSDYHP